MAEDAGADQPAGNTCHELHNDVVQRSDLVVVFPTLLAWFDDIANYACTAPQSEGEVLQKREKVALSPIDLF